MKLDEWFYTLDDALWLRADEEGRDEAAFIKRVLRLRKGQSVLDAPCGAGRVAYHLAKLGRTDTIEFDPVVCPDCGAIDVWIDGVDRQTLVVFKNNGSGNLTVDNFLK